MTGYCHTGTRFVSNRGKNKYRYTKTKIQNCAPHGIGSREEGENGKKIKPGKSSSQVLLLLEECKEEPSLLLNVADLDC